MHAHKNSSPTAVSEEAPASERRFREELRQIPTINHQVYGTCLVPTYPTQLLNAINQFATAGIGAWRGQASNDWGLDPSLVRRYRQHHERRPDFTLTEPDIRDAEKALIESARAAGLGTDLSDLEPLRHGIDELLTMASGRLLWWQPRSLSPRISAQQAAFVFGQVVDEPWGSIRLGGGGVGLDEIGVVPGAAVIFVSAQLKTVLNGIWEPMLGFSEESLFPDLAGFALAHSVARPFPANFTTNTPNS
jgi:hypothetical protein